MTCLVSFHVCTYYTIPHHVLPLNHVTLVLLALTYLITLSVDTFLRFLARSGLVIIRHAYTALNRVHTFIRVTAIIRRVLLQAFPEVFAYVT